MSETCQWDGIDSEGRLVTCSRRASFVVMGPTKPEPDSHAYSCDYHTGEFAGISIQPLGMGGIMGASGETVRLPRPGIKDSCF